METIARIHTDFSSKFGVPRQSGLIDELHATIVFEPKYRVDDAVRGLEAFSHIWLIWDFHEAHTPEWHPTVRPPRLGGNRRIGVFATRSPFRPNPIGLSCVRLEYIEHTPDRGCVLHVKGADLMDGTPIYDIKPYLPYTDAHPDAREGFTTGLEHQSLTVVTDCQTGVLTEEQIITLQKVIGQDPRPRYQSDETRVYGFLFAGHEVRFRVEGNTAHILTIEPSDSPA